MYVYEGSGGIVCCGCRFHVEVGNSPSNMTPWQAVVHLRQHRGAGHTVPLHASAELAEEAERWTWERVAWAVVWRWRAVMARTLCHLRGHLDGDAFPGASHASVQAIRNCRRCHRTGWRLDGGRIEWWAA